MKILDYYVEYDVLSTTTYILVDICTESLLEQRIWCVTWKKSGCKESIKCQTKRLCQPYLRILQLPEVTSREGRNRNLLGKKRQGWMAIDRC